MLDPTPNNTNLSANAIHGVDNLNNSELVTINNAAAGTYTIHVAGTSVPFGAQHFVVGYQLLFDKVTLTYPIGGEHWVPGETERVRWDSYGASGVFNIDLSNGIFIILCYKIIFLNIVFFIILTVYSRYIQLQHNKKYIRFKNNAIITNDNNKKINAILPTEYKSFDDLTKMSLAYTFTKNPYLFIQSQKYALIAISWISCVEGLFRKVRMSQLYSDNQQMFNSLIQRFERYFKALLI